MRRSSRFTVAAVLLTVAVVAAAFVVRPAESQTPRRHRLPEASQTPKSGGSLKVMLREDLSQGFAVHETATISVVWPSSPCFNNLVLLRPAQAQGERRHHHRRAGREVVVAGPLPQPRLLPPQGRQVARRQAVHLEGREVHLRHGARGARRRRQAPAQPAQGLVRQRRRHRGARSVHGGIPTQAPAALARSSCSPPATRRSTRRTSRPPQYRTTCVGTGPFKVKEWRQGEYVDYVKNTDYFVEGPAVSRRAPLRRHHGARHAHGGAAGRAARRRHAGRDDQGGG